MSHMPVSMASHLPTSMRMASHAPHSSESKTGAGGWGAGSGIIEFINLKSR